MKHNAMRPVHYFRDDGERDAANRPNPSADADYAAPPEPDPDDLSDFDVDLNDDRWEAFLADDDELDPAPEPGDFWPESD